MKEDAELPPLPRRVTSPLGCRDEKLAPLAAEPSASMSPTIGRLHSGLPRSEVAGIGFALCQRLLRRCGPHPGQGAPRPLATFPRKGFTEGQRPPLDRSPRTGAPPMSLIA